MQPRPLRVISFCSGIAAASAAWNPLLASSSRRSPRSIRSGVMSSPSAAMRPLRGICRRG